MRLDAVSLVIFHKNKTLEKIENELKEIIDSTVSLDQSIDNRSPIFVSSEDGKVIYGLEENDRATLTENKYRCRYSDGKLQFHPSQESKIVKITYYGIGFYKISSERIYYTKDGFNIESVKSILDEAISSIDIIRQTTKDSRDVTSAANECIRNINNLKTQLEQSENDRKSNRNNRQNNTTDTLNKLNSGIKNLTDLNNQVTT